jgi:hypothetical protein
LPYTIPPDEALILAVRTKRRSSFSIQGQAADVAKLRNTQTEQNE